MASTVSNGNDRSQKWQRPFTKGKCASVLARRLVAPKKSRPVLSEICPLLYKTVVNVGRGGRIS